MNNDQALRDHLLYLLKGGGAHMQFDELVASFPLDSINQKTAGVPYSPWQVLEHLRIAQWDILEFIRNTAHISPEFPTGYWPPSDLTAAAGAWQKTAESFKADLKAWENLVSDPDIDLFARIAHGDGQTILREILLVTDHNAYHLGTLALLQRLVNRQAG